MSTVNPHTYTYLLSRSIEDAHPHANWKSIGKFATGHVMSVDLNSIQIGGGRVQFWTRCDSGIPIVGTVATTVFVLFQYRDIGDALRSVEYGVYFGKDLVVRNDVKTSWETPEYPGIHAHCFEVVASFARGRIPVSPRGLLPGGQR